MQANQNQNSISGKAVCAVYPGTFDPPTLGHLDLIRRASNLFGKVVVAVAVAHHKKTMFTLDERVAMVKEMAKPWPHVEVLPFTGLVVDFAKASGASAMLRGVRSVTDFDFEAQLAGMNRSMAPQVETVYLTPDASFQHISSTLVREIANLKGNVEQFVSPEVLVRLKAKVQLTSQ